MPITINDPAHDRNFDGFAPAEQMLSVRLPELGSRERQEPSLGELLDDPIMHLLLARDGVRREEVVSIVRDVASRMVGNDCGGPGGLAAA